MSQVQFDIDGETLITREQIAGATSATLPSDMLAQAEAQLALLLGITQGRLASGTQAGAAVGYLFAELHKLRAAVAPENWQALVPQAQRHPVAELLHQDPFTAWSFDKPRGYSGDARLLDFIYRHPSVETLVADATPLGRAIYDYTSSAPAAAAVRERREILAQTVDRTAERAPGAEILTIAGGHLREAGLTAALEAGRIGRWIVLDQDPMSVGSMVRDFSGSVVEARDGSVKGLLGKTYSLGTFDCVYAAGLYDYLPENAAIRLTRVCLDLLKPGGEFLFANFNREIDDDGYMETFMNWPLLLRSEAEMREIADASMQGVEGTSEIFYGANRNIIYGICRKAN
ncbi:class I SAM-dependent methyltransferase [Aureimonas sp. ME7]|uniref:class I SAM-dependent methyltransferase n=1 Tax=Aureimonas sp. ME7 TaxID=2744252 RepID=UPI0015F64BAA|nr:class I SAM-dependent methyltransferase [Aureimonas sp. ME7]